MTYMTKDMEELGRLEEDFEATALDKRFSNKNKFNLLSGIVDGMVDVVHRSHRTQKYDVYDLAEYVEGYITRGDLGSALAETAFEGDDAEQYATRLNAYMQYRNHQVTLCARPLESFRLDP